MKNPVELLNQLIDALYAASPCCPEVHKLQMLAAEIKGQLQTEHPQP